MLAAPALLALLALLALPPPSTAATITVTNTNDSGAGSLRDAIDQSNASVGVFDTIAFNIAGSGVHTIAAASSLPTITDPVLINGATQPGYAGNPLIEIQAGSPLSAGLRITGGGSTVRALVINSFSAQIFLLTGGGNTIEGCYLGTDPTGTVGLSNGDGVYIQNSNGNLIGGTSASARNLLSGNGSSGVHVILADDNVIQGNRIGTTADGTAALGNGAGITIVGANTLVGGAAPGAGNLISGNTGDGVVVTSAGGGNTIQGNWIGTDVTGTLAIPNNFGIDVSNVTGSVVIGGSAPGEGNLVSGNASYGVFLNGGTHFSPVQGNLIGTDVTGLLPLPNGEAIGLNSLDVTDILIGGVAPGEGNTIAFNRGILPNASGGIWNLGLRVTIRGNSIHDNFGLGIDNGDVPGINANDPGDPDTGPNEYQNFPIVSSVTAVGPEGGSSTRIQGVLHSTPSTLYTLDFYENPACTAFPRDFLEGQSYLGSAPTTTDGAGTAAFDVTLPVQVAPGARITATATDPSGNTSEFSQRIVFSTLPTSGPPAGGTAFTLAGTDFGAGATVTVGGAAASGVNVASFTSITATTPALGPGTVNDITVANTDGSAGTLERGFVSDFLDVPPAQLFHFHVTILVSNTITVGVGGGLYGVDQPTLRQQMAVFLLKSKYGVCYVPPPCITPIFTDVPCSSGYSPWINELVAEGITGGCGTGIYCPISPVQRQQMAVFLLKTFEDPGYAPPACTTATFTDVPCSSPFAPWVYELVARNITAGCGGGNYCPTATANRGQMATFLVKTFGLQ